MRRAIRGDGLPMVMVVASLLVASCSSTPPRLREVPLYHRDLEREAASVQKADYSYWNDEAGRGSPRVTINLGEQTAHIYRGDSKVGRSRVATGISGYRTPTGSFTILEKSVTKRSNLYGRILDRNGNVTNSDADARRDRVPPGGRFVGASMPYWMRLTSAGVGMHAGPIPSPGNPASHGCIRMPPRMARLLFQHAPVGTPVKIVP